VFLKKKKGKKKGEAPKSLYHAPLRPGGKEKKKILPDYRLRSHKGGEGEGARFRTILANRTTEKGRPIQCSWASAALRIRKGKEMGGDPSMSLLNLSPEEKKKKGGEGENRR